MIKNRRKENKKKNIIKLNYLTKHFSLPRKFMLCTSDSARRASPFLQPGHRLLNQYFVYLNYTVGFTSFVSHSMLTGYTLHNACLHPLKAQALSRHTHTHTHNTIQYNMISLSLSFTCSLLPSLKMTLLLCHDYF